MKSYQAFSLNTRDWNYKPTPKEKIQKHSLIEIEQHAIKQWMGQERDQGRNQKVSGNKWKWTHNSPKLMEHREGSPEREVYCNTDLSKKDRNISNKRPNPIPSRTGGTTINKAQRE